MFKVKKIELKSNFSENALDSKQMKQVLGGFAGDSSVTTSTATMGATTTSMTLPPMTERPVSVSVTLPMTDIPRK